MRMWSVRRASTVALRCALICSVCVAVAEEHSAAHDQDAAVSCTAAGAAQDEMLLGPHNFTSSIIWLEKRADLALPRLVFKSVRARIVDEDIDNFLNTMKDVLALGEPFTVLWDARESLVTFSSPAWRQIMLGKAFADEHAVRIDSLVQAHAVLLRNMFVRAFLRVTIKLTAPPQPIHVGESEEDALTFAQGQRESRSWVKDAYDRFP